MSIRYEWMAADATRVTYLPDGYDVTTQRPSDDPYDGPVENRVNGGALVLSVTEAVVLEGTLDQLHQLAERINDALRTARLSTRTNHRTPRISYGPR